MSLLGKLLDPTKILVCLDKKPVPLDSLNDSTVAAGKLMQFIRQISRTVLIARCKGCRGEFCMCPQTDAQTDQSIKFTALQLAKDGRVQFLPS